ncbi:MAG: hypothetical protein LBI57_04235 [Helicobacteraceae bacterium]|nr:hypothetical protein [Helicobacteraceae bacterium]
MQFDASAAYRRARLQYALRELKKEMRLYEKSVEKRVRRARTDAELKEILESIETLRETRRFYRKALAPKSPSLEFAALLS